MCIYIYIEREREIRHAEIGKLMHEKVLDFAALKDDLYVHVSIYLSLSLYISIYLYIYIYIHTSLYKSTRHGGQCR